MRLPPPLLLPILTLLILHLPALTLAAQSATTFCKCVCAGNSTIVALNPPPSSSFSQKHSTSLKFSRSVPALLPRNWPLQQKSDVSQRDEGSDQEKKQQQQPHHTPTCADCNRAFCLDQGLQICRDVKAEEVFASCFQRDSLKDELVVILFLACTGGLLGWALLRPFVEKVWRGSSVAGLVLPSASSSAAPVRSVGNAGRGGVVRGGGGGAASRQPQRGEIGGASRGGGASSSSSSSSPSRRGQRKTYDERDDEGEPLRST